MQASLLTRPLAQPGRTPCRNTAFQRRLVVTAGEGGRQVNASIRYTIMPLRSPPSLCVGSRWDGLALGEIRPRQAASWSHGTMMSVSAHNARVLAILTFLRSTSAHAVTEDSAIAALQCMCVNGCLQNAICSVGPIGVVAAVRHQLHMHTQLLATGQCVYSHHQTRDIQPACCIS